MSINGIIIDSVGYPFSNWMRFLFLGIIILISFSPYIALYLIKINYLTFISLNIIGFLFIGSFVRGYLLKIISESLTSFKELPELMIGIKCLLTVLKYL